VNNRKFYDLFSIKKKLSYSYIVVAAALLIILLNYGARFSFGIFFKPMLNEFDWNRTLVAGSFAVSMLFQGVAAIVMGRASDKLGPRLVMTVCGVLFGLGYLLMSQISDVWQLYLFYGAMIGTGLGGPFVVLLSTVARLFDKKRGMMTGIVMSGMGIGTFFMTPISNWLISIYDWRTSYILVGGIVLVIGVLAAQVVRRDTVKTGQPLSGVNIEDNQSSVARDAGLSPAKAICTWQFWVAMVIFFCMGYCVFAINVHLVPNITDLGISSATAANVMAIWGAAIAVGCILLGGTIDRIGSRLVCVIGLTLVMLSLFWLVIIKEVWIFYMFAIAFGIGYSGCLTMGSSLTADLFGMKSHGAIFGILNFGFTGGAALGPFLTGYLFDSMGNYQVSFLICGAIAAVGLTSAALLRPIKKQETAT
jgi:MFS family permease